MTRAPLALHEFAVPATKRVGRDKEREALARWAEPLQHGEDEALLGSDMGSHLLTLQDVKFLTKDEDLDVFGA
jgi:hypothetical protein